MNDMALEALARDADRELREAQARSDVLRGAREAVAERDDLQDWLWVLTTVLALSPFALDAPPEPSQQIPSPRRAPALETVLTQRKRCRAQAQARYSARQREAT